VRINTFSRYNTTGEIIMAWSYAKCEQVFATCRWPHRGKPIQNNTWLFYDNDNKSYAICYHATDIVVFHEDGSIEIDTNWTTITTMMRIWRYAGRGRFSQYVRGINGRAVSPNRVYVGRDNRGKIFPWQAKGNKIRFDPTGAIDMSTVAPITVEYIDDVKAVNKAAKTFKVLKQNVMLRERIGVKQKQNWWSHDVRRWFENSLQKPIDDIDFF
jgi:hypothetical protein